MELIKTVCALTTETCDCASFLSTQILKFQTIKNILSLTFIEGDFGFTCGTAGPRRFDVVIVSPRRR